MYRDYYCGEPTEDLVNEEITISGWINKRRDHGGLLFIDLRDRTGLIQVVFDPENLILNNIEKYIDLNLKEKASLFYFKNSNFFKKKIKSDSFKKAIKKAIKKKVNNQNLSNFFLVEYNKLCEKLYTVLKKKIPNFFY